MDTDTFEELSAIQEQQRFLAAIEEGEKAFEEGKVYPVKEVIAELKAKYGI
ncbi:MAG: hypothetical protein JNJ45_08095 [Chthonomonas sp.]|nr:hypothetical protein [Chthonomonas sp.]